MPSHKPSQMTQRSIKTRSFLLSSLLLLSLLTPALAAAVDLRWVGCGITRKAFMQDLADAYKKKTGIEIAVEGGGATRGIRDTSKGASDMGGSCRSQIRRGGSLFPIREEAQVTMVPVAWDALVVIAHPNNPVNSLTLDQVREIYHGNITNWQTLGGEDQPINLAIRKGKISGVGRMMREMIFADYDLEFTDRAQVFPSSGPLEELVEKDMAAMGITGVSSARRRNVKILALEGVEPTYDNIKDGKYMLYRPLYLVTPPRGSKPEVDEFVEFALSSEGREILRKVGTVPYTDAIHLMMKQRQQWRKAADKGLVR